MQLVRSRHSSRQCDVRILASDASVDSNNFLVSLEPLDFGSERSFNRIIFGSVSPLVMIDFRMSNLGIVSRLL